MNAYDRGGPGVSGGSFDRWVQRSELTDDSAITKMQHHYWVTKQALSRKLGKKEDECIVASDAELDAKLELFRSIQESCSYLQRIIDKYQERLCNLAQEENTMGRFLKEAAKQDKTRAGKMMSAVGKSLSYSGQQRLALRAPLVRLYQEVETFRQRAIEDTLQNVQSMEKARTEYRAALSWMKNISQELDPDTSKQLERFRKVQTRVRHGKVSFDNQALDCLQKVDLLAAARCNMFSHALVLYQSTLLNFTKKSAQAYSTIANSFKGYQRYEFTVVKELAETSTKLAHETGGDHDIEDKDKLLFFDSEFHDNVEEAQEVKSNEKDNDNCNGQDEKLLNIDDDITGKTDDFGFETLDLNSSNLERKTTDDDCNLDFDKLFGCLSHDNKQNVVDKQSKELETSLAELDLAMDSFTSGNINFDFGKTSLSQDQTQQSIQLNTSENLEFLDDIFNIGTNSNVEWDSMTNDTFLPPGILKQSLGDAALGKKSTTTMKTKLLNSDEKKKCGKSKGNSWLDLFAELDPLENNAIESLSKSGDSNAPA